jgi:hypothetical protein
MTPAAELTSAVRKLRSQAATLAVAVLLATCLALAPMGPAGAADEPTTTVASSTDTTSETTAPAPVDAGLGDLDAGSNTPSPRGQAEPPRAQRVADSAIAAGLLVVLVAGVVIAIWTGRRRSSDGTDGTDGPVVPGHSER